MSNLRWPRIDEYSPFPIRRQLEQLTHVGAGGFLWALGVSQELVTVAVVTFVGAAMSIVFRRTIWPLPDLTSRPRGR